MKIPILSNNPMKQVLLSLLLFGSCQYAAGQIQFEKGSEFEIYNASKYIRARVKIDRSSKDLEKLTLNRNPVRQCVNRN